MTGTDLVLVELQWQQNLVRGLEQAFKRGEPVPAPTLARCQRRIKSLMVALVQVRNQG